MPFSQVEAATEHQATTEHQDATEHLETHQVLVCSIAHLTAKEGALLKKKNPNETPFIYWKRPEGFLIYCAELPPDGKDYPSALKVAQFAHALGFTWVMMDQDGAEVEDLPHYRW